MRQQKTRPQVIFLDAVGTLFGVKGSVGEIYSELAQRFGVKVSPIRLNQAFFQSFQAAPPPAFRNTDPAELQAREFTWWLAITNQTFKQAGVLDQFTDFAEFFAQLYDHFATASPWVLYPDVSSILNHWQRQGIKLGVVSNFDSRLYAVLQSLELGNFFESITISTEAGVAKPDPQIFAIALAKHHCAPESAWHIGDSYNEDYRAACNAGLRGIWLKRKG